ncbi:MAG: hypothetical protein F6K23_18990 [Okeania sp. SIO2C9]|uniref:hypothetical protein n=1 Tax=Okeania sp. SIO2C9 TaxID=2607791 RepID=UPI0013C0AAD7|nr:hypothetical protein [Okeania sp. SIO2C9]NEQ74940.1 hypothetical protein [Okeania sp. SIO2C9]
MSETNNKKEDISLLQAWQKKIELANTNNIFCHCHNCGYEWVDSSFEEICPSCKSSHIERISCWQFPDD